MDPVIAQMQATLERQRRAFNAHPYPSLAERRANLMAVKRVVQRYQDIIARAVSADFGRRSASETKLIEAMGPILSLIHI